MAYGGLVHTTDNEPGIIRRGRTRFRYVEEGSGDPVRDRDTLERIKGLAVPPAWTDVWITTEAAGHLQATGRDARGRKVYRYHPGYRSHRDLAKFDELVPFGHVLGDLRRQVDDDLGRRGLPFERVVALVIALLEVTLARVGNEDYARDNRSYGLTTLRDRHARVQGARLRLRFAGKSGQVHDLDCTDRRVSRLVERCQDLPGQLLFQFEGDDDEPHPVRSTDVNDYLRAVTGLDVTAKTFRTWHGSVLAAAGLAEIDPPATKRARTRALLDVVEEVAQRLGNTPTVARNSYIHPVVVEHYGAGELPERWAQGPKRAAGGLDADERRLLALLEG